MKKIFFSLLGLLTAFCSFSQSNPNLVFSSPLEVFGFSPYFAYAGNGYNIIYSRKQAGKNGWDFKLEKLDKECKSVLSTTLDKKSAKTKDAYLQSVTQLGKKLYLLSMTRDDGILSYYAQSIDLNTLVPQEPKKIGELSYKWASEIEFNPFYFIESQDSSKIMLISKGHKEINSTCRLFDGDLNLLWKKDLDLFMHEKYNPTYEEESLEIDNNGVFYILNKIYVSKTGKFPVFFQIYNYKVVKFTNSGNQKTVYELKPEGKIISDAALVLNNGNDFSLIGLYGTVNSNVSNGLFIAKPKSSGSEISFEKFIEFDNDFISKMESNNIQQAKHAPGILHLNLNDIKLNKDGSTIITSEQQIESYSATASQETYVSMHYYNNFCIFKLNSKSELEWKTPISKQQVGDHVSFYSVFSDDGTSLILNDCNKNKSQISGGESKSLNIGAPGLYPANKNDAVITCIKIDNKGGASKTIISKFDEDKVLFEEGQKVMNLTEKYLYFITEKKSDKIMARYKVN